MIDTIMGLLSYLTATFGQIGGAAISIFLALVVLWLIVVVIQTVLFTVFWRSM